MSNKSLYDYFSKLFSNSIAIKLLEDKNPMASGYLLKTDGNKYFLKRYKKTRKLNDILFEHEYINYLNSHQLLVNQPIKLMKKTVHSIEGDHYSLFEFADGCPKSVNILTIKEKISFAKTVAMMHIVSQKYKPKYNKINRDLFNFDFENWVINSHPENHELDPLKVDLDLMRKKFDTKVSKVTKMVIHNDLSINNIFFNNNKVSMIVDFDDCCLGSIISDIACAVFDFFCDGSKLDSMEVELFIQEYSKHIKLDKIEIDLIDDLLKHRLIMYILFYFYYWNKTKSTIFLRNYNKYYSIFNNYDKLLNLKKEQL